MDQLPLFFTLTTILVTIGLSFLAIYFATQPGAGRQLANANRPVVSSSGHWFARLLLPTVKRWSPRFHSLHQHVDVAGLTHKLELAGYPAGLDAEQFFTLRLMLALAGLAVGLLTSVVGVFGGVLMMLLAGLGYLLPRFWLGRRAARRQQSISLDMPDLIDKLVVMIRAGLGLDQAIGYLTAQSSGPLMDELRHWQEEIALGVPRPQAWQNLSRRNDSEQLDGLVSDLLQAEALGVPIADKLAERAAIARRGRSQLARELAGKSSSYISLINVGCLGFPTVIFLLVVMLRYLIPLLSGVFGGN